MNLFSSLFLLLLLGMMAGIGYFIKELPKIVRALWVEASRGKNEKEIQKEAFFRKIKGSDIDDAFNYWTSLMVDMDNKMSNIGTQDGQKEFREMQQKVLMYGSNETVTILSSMMQHFYKSEDINKVTSLLDVQDNSKEIHSYMLMFYIAYLISSLKKDFTGYVIQPRKILAIKINDIDSHKNKELFEQAEKNVQEELKNLEVTI